MGFISKPVSPVLQRDNPLAWGLSAAWPFYEGNGKQLYDVSGNQNNSDSFSSNSPQWAGSPFGHALYFTTTGIEHVAIPDAPSLNPSAITISALVSCTGGAGSYRTIFVKRADFDGQPWGAPYARYAARINSSAQLECWINNGGDFSKYFISGVLPWASSPDGSWHTVTIVYNGTLSAWVDGVLLGSTSIGDALLSSPYHFYIGSDNSVFSETWVGYIADVKIYGRGLSAAEIAQLHYDPFAIYRPRSRLWEVPTTAATPFTDFDFDWNPQFPIRNKARLFTATLQDDPSWKFTSTPTPSQFAFDYSPQFAERKKFRPLSNDEIIVKAAETQTPTQQGFSWEPQFPIRGRARTFQSNDEQFPFTVTATPSQFGWNIEVQVPDGAKYKKAIHLWMADDNNWLAQPPPVVTTTIKHFLMTLGFGR